MLLTDSPSQELAEAFRTFAWSRLPLEELPPARERAFLEMSVAHLFWAIGRSRFLEDILVVSSVPDFYHRTRELAKETAGVRRRSGFDLQYALKANILNPLSRQVPEAVFELLHKVAREITSKADTGILEVRRACYEKIRWQFDGSHLIDLNWHALPDLLDLETILVHAFLADQFHGTLRSLEGYLQLALRAPFWGIIEQTFIVCQSPVAVHFNASGNLHRTDGNAVEYPDGKGFPVVDGIVLPNNIFDETHEVSAEDILHEDNMEVRRVMLERLGIDTFLEQIKAQVVSRDDFGTLYHSNIQPDEWLAMQRNPLGVGNDPVNLAFVKLLNSTPEPGTTDVFKEYLLRVPPDIRTPQAAVAWSFGLEEEAYAPEWET